jgi:hypothetical protein
VLAVNLTVTKISGVGEDSVFMGIIEVRPGGLHHSMPSEPPTPDLSCPAQELLASAHTSATTCCTAGPVVAHSQHTPHNAPRCQPNHPPAFCAVQPLPITPGTAKAWVMASGSVISVDASFTDWFG